MDEEKEAGMGQVIRIDERQIRDHLGEMVRGTVEETLNAMLDALDRIQDHKINRLDEVLPWNSRRISTRR